MFVLVGRLLYCLSTHVLSDPFRWASCKQDCHYWLCLCHPKGGKQDVLHCWLVKKCPQTSFFTPIECEEGQQLGIQQDVLHWPSASKCQQSRPFTLPVCDQQSRAFSQLSVREESQQRILQYGLDSVTRPSTFLGQLTFFLGNRGEARPTPLRIASSFLNRQVTVKGNECFQGLVTSAMPHVRDN